jgi:hypothetical protein
MAYLRLFRRIQIAPGVRLNLSKSGPSLSLGVRGAHVTVGRRGVTRTIGLPGTGVYWTDRQGRHTGAHTAPHFADAAGAEGKPRRGCGCVSTLLWIIGALLVLGVIGQLAGGK